MIRVADVSLLLGGVEGRSLGEVRRSFAGIVSKAQGQLAIEGTKLQRVGALKLLGFGLEVIRYLLACPQRILTNGSE